MSSTQENKPGSPYGIIIILVGLAAILWFLLVPTIGHNLPSPGMRMGANLRSIAQAYQGFAMSDKTPRTIAFKPGMTAHDVAYILARDTGLNDASVWASRTQKANLDFEIPQAVIRSYDGPLDPAFARLTLDWEVVANIPPDAPPTTPVAWTRGLRKDGTWPSDSYWGGKGGHVAYFDGHVDWVQDKLSLEQGWTSLVNYTTHKPTVNYQEALPPGAVVLSAEPGGKQR